MVRIILALMHKLNKYFNYTTYKIYLLTHIFKSSKSYYDIFRQSFSTEIQSVNVIVRFACCIFGTFSSLISLYLLIQNLLDSTASEKYNTLQPLVIKEIIKRPKTTIFAKRIGGQVRIVGINVAFGHGNLVLNSRPQLLAHSAVLLASCSTQVRIHGIHNPVQRWLLAKLVALSIQEVVIWLESRVEGGNQVKQGLAADGVTKGPVLVPRNATAVAWRQPLRRGQCLQVIGVHSVLGVKLFVHGFVSASHFARVTLNSSYYSAISRFYA